MNKKIWLFVGAMLAFLLSAATPAIVQANVLPIPVGATYEYHSSNGMNLSVETSPGGKRSEVAVDAHLTVADALDLRDHVVLQRSSALPVPEESRTGLQYFFPFNTEHRSFEYYDVIAEDETTLDYQKRDGDLYTFAQSIHTDTYDGAHTITVHRVTGEITEHVWDIDLRDADGKSVLKDSYTLTAEPSQGHITALAVARGFGLLTKALGFILIILLIIPWRAR